MLYSTFIKKAEELTIQQLENGIWYLEPEWQDMIYRNILYKNNLNELDDLEDSYLDGWYTLEDILKLEVTKRNSVIDKRNDVINWLYNVITATIEPAILQEETDYIKNVVEYMKVNHGLETGDSDGDN